MLRKATQDYLCTYDPPYDSSSTDSLSATPLAIPVLVAVSRIAIALHPRPVTSTDAQDESADSGTEGMPVRLISEDDARAVLKDAAKAAGNDLSFVSCISAANR